MFWCKNNGKFKASKKDQADDHTYCIVSFLLIQSQVGECFVLIWNMQSLMEDLIQRLHSPVRNAFSYEKLWYNET